MSRATIELQEVRIGDDKQVTYGQPLKLPCDSAAALVTDLMKHFLLKKINNILHFYVLKCRY
ncbi:MAG: hypothetical protein ACXADY_17870 [Candidatus Hodarchaeales archaeon]